MKEIDCPRCPHRNAFYIVVVTEDYVTLECPICGWQFAITADQDSEK